MTWSRLLAGQAATDAPTVAILEGAPTVVGATGCVRALLEVGVLEPEVVELAPDEAPSTLFAALTPCAANRVTPAGLR